MSVYRTIEVKKLTPNIGGEISGIDLTKPLSADQVTDLKQALADHLAIFFRDQPISFENHKYLANHFGGIHIAPSTAPWRVPGHPEITTIHADKDSTFVAGEDWHSDMSCDAEPPLGSILYLHTVPEPGGDTCFANMYLAYEALSDRMKAHLEGLSATHDAVVGFGGLTPPDLKLPRSVHPVIRTHPVTGKKALYVNRGFTVRIEGIPKGESDALLGYLFQHVQHPQFQCRFHWRPHSIAFWDNRSCQHTAIWDYFPNTRSGYRVQIMGDKPV
ncbi:MAG TPA: TauD/TfdA family dioxygenase [Alphaproteobacteria bacterium]|nr:TauD/TfdA family dioxygenase [Alphaproteobacteria bacterium]